MYHSFNVEIAAKFGIESAVILNFLEFWISKNKANEKHFHDGRYWTYNSRKALLEIFPYMTDRMIRTAISHLVDGGVIITGNYSTDPMNKTNWYAITDYGFQILENPKALVDDTKTTNALVQNDQSIGTKRLIEDTETTNGLSNINNIDIYNSSIPVKDNSYKNNNCASENAQCASSKEIEEYFEKLWDMYPLKKGKGRVSAAKKKYLFNNISLEEWQRAIDRYLEYVKNASFDLQLMHGSTFCNSGHVDYLDKNYLTEDQGEKVPEVAKEPEGPVDYGWGDD